MKYKIVSYILFSCCTFSLYAKPASLPLQINKHHKLAYSSLLSFQTNKLNIKLPLLPQDNKIKQSNKKLTTESALILANAKKQPLRINFLVLRASKNTVLKAILKRKSYGLRYTKIW